MPVLLLSIALNVPKFLECKFHWADVGGNGTSTADEGELDVAIAATDLRNHPDYIRFYINWTRLVTTGLLPMGALIFFNWNIFRYSLTLHVLSRAKEA